MIAASERSTQRFIRELEREKFILVKERPGSTPHYSFLRHSSFGEDLRSPLPYLSPPSDRSVTPPVTNVAPELKRNTSYSGTVSGNRSISSSSGGGANPQNARRRFSSPSLKTRTHGEARPHQTNYVLSEAGNPRADSRALSELLSVIPADRYDHKLPIQIARTLKRRGFTVDQFAADIRPHLVRLAARRDPIGPGFFQHHAEIFKPAPPPRIVCDWIGPDSACQQCGDGGFKDCNGFRETHATARRLVVADPDALCSCASGDQWRVMLADLFPTSKKENVLATVARASSGR